MEERLKIGPYTLQSTFCHKNSIQEYHNWRCECGKLVYLYMEDALARSNDSCICNKGKRKPTTISNSFKEKYQRKYAGEINRIRSIWNGMMNRCYVKDTESYLRYGRRGITVCDNWHNFENFFIWSIENGYQYPLSIERVDFNKGYSPDNCKWIPFEMQGKNSRSVKPFTFRRKTMNLSEWAKMLGAPISRFHYVKTNMGVAEAIIYFEKKRNEEINSKRLR